MNDRDTTLDQLRARMAEFVAQRDWRKFHRPKNLAMGLAIEAAELMEHFQWVDHEQADALAAQPENRQEIADEMADVLAYLLSLSNALNVDLSRAFESKMAKNDRKYPADEVRGHYKRPRRPQIE
jgi:NTP pyrophosphatase (non-canonical NTP hydrolase)